MTFAERMHEWIAARLSEGRTVYATSYGHAIKITPKHVDLIRVRNGHCEVQRGRRWDSINGCKITAQ
jgi:hypothetical protein